MSQALRRHDAIMDEQVIAMRGPFSRSSTHTRHRRWLPAAAALWALAVVVTPHGQTTPAVSAAGQVLVPGVASSGLSDADTARVLNYVIREWGDGVPRAPYSTAEVASIRTSRVDDIVALRGKIIGDLARRGIRIFY